MTRFLSTFVLLFLPLLSRHGDTAPVYDASETEVQGTEEASNAVPTTVLSSLTTGETAPVENGERSTTLEPRSLKNELAAKSVTAGFGTRKPGDGLPKLRLPAEWPPSRDVPTYDVRKGGAPVIKEPEYDSSPPGSPMPRPLKRGLPRDATPPFTESDEDSSEPESDDDDDEDEDEELESQGEWSPKRAVPRAGPPKTRLPTRPSPKIEESDYDSTEEESDYDSSEEASPRHWPPKTGLSGYGPQTRFPRTREGTGDRSPYLGPGMWKTGPDFDEPLQKRQRQDTRVSEIVPHGDFGGLDMNNAYYYGKPVPRSADDYPLLKHLPAMSQRFFEGI